MSHLTIISPVMPFPPLSGGTAHIVQVTRQLARAFEVHMYALATDPAAVTWGSLAEYCVETRAFARTRRSKWGPAPPAVRHEYSQQLIDYLQHAWRVQPPAIVQL